MSLRLLGAAAHGGKTWGAQTEEDSEQGSDQERDQADGKSDEVCLADDALPSSRQQPPPIPPASLACSA